VRLCSGRKPKIQYLLRVHLISLINIPKAA
jgi:hypothetical protein